jgi:hypothetical protein
MRDGTFRFRKAGVAVLSALTASVGLWGMAPAAHGARATSTILSADAPNVAGVFPGRSSSPGHSQEKARMSDLMLLTDAEIDEVAGGQTIGIFTATQSAASTLTQTATANATNSGAVTATASGLGSVAAAAGAEASAANLASVSQRNSIEIG